MLLVEEDPRDNKKYLKVNFDSNQVVVFKEVKYLEWLLPTLSMAHKSIPNTLKSRTNEAYARYPIALALNSALSSLTQTKKRINGSNNALLLSHIGAVRDTIKEAIGGSKRTKWVKWDAKDVNEWVSLLTSKIFSLQERVEDVNITLATVEDLLTQLSTCTYNRESFMQIINAFQAIVEELPMKGLANINYWVTNLDKQIEDVLKSRLSRSILAWCQAFNGATSPEKEKTAAAKHSGTSPSPGAKPARRMTLADQLGSFTASEESKSKDKSKDSVLGPMDLVTLETSTSEIVLAKQVLFITPPLEDAKVYWVTAFHQHISVVASLPRIQASRYQVFHKGPEGATDYGNILLELPHEILQKPYINIDEKLSKAQDYVNKWLAYQPLWDAAVLSLAESINRDNHKWQQLLREMAVARTAVENTKEQKAFGPIIISNRQVQNKINLKYDQWQKESQIRFGMILLEDIKKEQQTLSSAKNKLESISLDGASKDVIAAVQFILETKASVPHHDDVCAELKSAEKLLQVQRFPFPHEWMPVSNVLGPLADMKAVLARRVSSMEAALPSLQQKLRAEHESLNDQAGEFLEKWTANKPMSGDLEAGEVLKSLAEFSEDLGVLQNNTDRVQNAMTALGMDYVSDDRLNVVEQEMAGIREAWQAVAPITTKLAGAGSTPLKDINTQKLRKILDALNVELEELPAKLRSYPIVEAVVEKIKVCITYQPLIRDLSTEALKERHWKSLNEVLGITTPTVHLTAGHIWAANAMSHKKFIMDTLAMAQGELALEEFLKSLREQWTKQHIELVPRDGVKIVVMDEEIFGTMEDHLSSLTALKQSPYFKNVAEFTEETLNWENRLTNLRMLCDALLEVQKKWLYLRGIFKGNEIKQQLPQQATKFKSTDQEYSVLIKRIAAKPMILELLQIDNLAKNLERQDSTMAMIQKALGEYLERQRQIFPRFYFVNNDDLVEIVGNSNEPAKIITHFVKMFSAMSAVTMVAKEGAAPIKGSDPPVYPQIGTHMGSKEGEFVPFETKIDLAVGVKEWLATVQGQMTISLATLMQEALKVLPETNEQMLAWISNFPAQVIMLASQVSWCASIESGLTASSLPALLTRCEGKLRSLSESVLNDMDPPLRKKCEQLLTEMVHQRDTTRQLISSNVPSKTDFGWVYHLRFYWDPKGPSILQMLSVKMANASFFYGFEYLGIAERLVHTGLTDRCYLTLTQALHFGMGGNPFGPAGTGKTESVKMLGAQMGRFCLVFNCDKSFDYAAMGRIFSGLAQVGAWGCFDEFNRLEERILSAVSQQILGIQKALLNGEPTFELMGSPCKLSRDIGIFVTMNPGYAGRSNLPDNLKQMFRAVAMAVPDRKLIAQVMLYSQGIVTAESLSGNIVLLFILCEEQLSAQSHYDFGLRALKSVLVSAGELKRNALKMKSKKVQGEEEGAPQDQSEEFVEAQTLETEKLVLIEATCGSILPKLVAEDIPLFTALLQAVFPGCEIPKMNDEKLIKALKTVCLQKNLEFAGEWAEKLLQLKSLLDVRHGVMLVGPSGTGKTAAWTTLLEALTIVDKGSKSDSYIIDPKAIPLEQLYGNLDPHSLEWTDGVFTKLLRKVSDTSNGKALKRSWIIFDGDVDPEWAENLNSVLDDNKLLTLPSGDRLKIPPNVRILMEVDTLRHATLATVSRAGMVWYASDTLSLDMVLRQQLIALRKDDIQSMAASYGDGKSPAALELQKKFCDAIEEHIAPEPAIIGKALTFAHSADHIMEITTGGVLSTLQKMLKRGIAIAVDHNDTLDDSEPMTDEHINNFAVKWLLFCTLWSFGGSMNVKNRYVLSDMISQSVEIGYDGDAKLLDLSADVETGEWREWSSLVPRIEIEANQVSATNIIVATTDTERHYVVIEAWLESHKPLILCGPPGSGKSMTLTNVLDNAPQYILASLNFAAGSKPDLIHKTFEQYCEVLDSQNGLIMMPSRTSYRENQWLVVFMDECNLPAEDAYGTQTIMMFVRQCVEQGGFWNEECKWVTLRRIQFVGACNPPTDAGRVIMSNRFLRHAPLLLVDYPVEESFKQIYGTFVNGLLKLHPNLKGLADPLTSAMVRCFLKNQIRFTPDVAPQYIYSPRELSRWMRALYEAMEPVDAMTPEELVRLWCNEGLRLFHDRCMTSEEKEWVVNLLDDLAEEFFAPHGIDCKKALEKPLLFSNQVNGTYQSLDIEVLRNFIQARLKVFCEEELDVPLVIFDDVLDHVLRIDNVLSHPMGHLLLVGESGVGKTVLTKFVSWMNGLTIFTIKANNRYSIEDFDNDLRTLLKRVGVDGEKISFIFDESNALDSAFLERMNSLLASGEVPGLFEGEERTALMNACRDAFAQKDDLIIDSEDEIQRRFTKIVQRNLHVIFTMNPAGGDFAGRCTTSPALFNRCVVDWFGTWPFDGLTQVGYEFTKSVDTGFNTYTGAQDGKAGQVLQQVAAVLKKEDSITLTEAITAAVICLHNTAQKMTVRQGKLTGRYHFLSPRDYLDFIHKFKSVEEEKRGKLQELANNIRTGLTKLIETQDSVNKMNKEMVIKGETLKQKEIDANNKLSQMIESQNEAEKQKANAEKLTVQLEKDNADIAIRAAAVEQELSEAEPMLNAAKLAVQGVKKPALDEVRSLGKPPVPVRMTMECVCVMLGQDQKKMTDWAEVRKFIKDVGFIEWVLKYDPYKVTDEMKKVVMVKYLNNPDITQEMVDKASKACGPLFMWAGSIVKYATLLNNIKPMTDEVAMLEKLSVEQETARKTAIGQVQDLENEIKQYKADYAISVRDTEMIRTEMETVTIKVNRAVALLSSLEEEKVRWSATSDSFTKQMESLIGDNLLTAAFLTYGGVFDHKGRKKLMTEWASQLEELGIECRSDLSIIEYLSTSGDHLQWRDWALPLDNLALENAILLERFNRYPMIIDPSGQATNFLNNKYGGGKLVKTSFLDANFIKILATAIRFGNPILVQDVETLDPVLNPILNKEFQKTGGRTLIRVGTEEIDFSPKFVIYLTTRNPLAQFSPDLCSRTTVVNFSVTPASLEAQALTCVLKAERPDVDRRRTDVLKLQGAQAAKMQDLQDQLLAKISAVQGNILDDDSVIQTLERIKREAAELNDSIRETLETLEDVKKVSNLYMPIAVTLAAAYFSLEGLPDVNFLYQYSLNFFLEVVDTILSIVPPPPTEFNGDDEVIAEERLALLKPTFFSEIARRVLRGLLYVDKVMFIVRLAQVSTMGNTSMELTEAELDLLLKGAGAVMLDSSSSMLQKFKEALQGKITDNIAKALISLSLLPAFTGLHASLTSDSDAWIQFIEDAEPEKIVPIKWIKPQTGGDAPQRVALLQLLIIKAFRPERILFALDMYVSAVFGSAFDWRDLSKADLRVIVEQDSRNSSPIMLCSGPGQDASGKVDILATDMGHKLLAVSMGAGESFIEADKSLSMACKSGSWLLLKNVHLCADWLAALEKRLNGMTMAEDFRLFLTCEIHPKLPHALLRGSEVVVYEASTGVKANIERFYSSIPVERIEKKPTERVRLYGLLAWFNAVVQERLRYTPLGWTKKHEFTEADTNCSLTVIDQWIDGMAGDRGNVDPADLPWDALRVLLSQSLFGGRIDHPFDQNGLDSFITSVFTPKNYEANAVLAFEYDGTPLVTLPSNLGRLALEDWIKGLPDTNSPSWIGLPVTAESQLKIYMAQQILGNLTIFQNTIDASDAGDDEDSGGYKGLQEMVERWMAVLPCENSLPAVSAEQTTDASSMPLERYFAREVIKGRQTRKQVMSDLSLVKGFCMGEEKTSNIIRDLISCFTRGVIPTKWQANFTVSARMTLATWIGDLSARLKNVEKYRQVLSNKSNNKSQVLTKIQNISYWMGLLFLPEAMVTATRQQAAQVIELCVRLFFSLLFSSFLFSSLLFSSFLSFSFLFFSSLLFSSLTALFSFYRTQVQKWALDQIELYLEIDSGKADSCQESVVEGLLLEGAKFTDGVLRLSEELRCSLPPSKLIWRLKSDRVEGEEPLKFPFYLNDNRNDKSVIVVLIDKTKCDAAVEKHVWVQRSVGFIMQAPV